MMHTWRTQVQDLAIAREIIKRYAPLYQGQLPLLADYQIDESKDVIQVTFPDWLETLVAIFKTVHSEQYYPFILENVMQVLTDQWIEAGDLTAEDAELYRFLLRYHLVPPHLDQIKH